MRAFQARLGMEANGRLDLPTLAALGLLPGQQSPGMVVPRRGNSVRRPLRYAPTGEPVYQGR